MPVSKVLGRVFSKNSPILSAISAFVSSVSSNPGVSSRINLLESISTGYALTTFVPKINHLKLHSEKFLAHHVLSCAQSLCPCSL